MLSNNKLLVERQLKNAIKKIIKEFLSSASQMDMAIQSQREEIGQEAEQTGGVDGYLKSNWNYIKNPARIDGPIRKYIVDTIKEKVKDEGRYTPEKPNQDTVNYYANFVTNSWISDILRNGPSALKAELLSLKGRGTADKESLKDIFNIGKAKLNNNFKGLLDEIDMRKSKGDKGKNQKYYDFGNAIIDKAMENIISYWQNFNNMNLEELLSSRLFENKKIRRVKFIK